MTNLILTSNYSENTLEGVGFATLLDNTISITADPFTEAVLLRGVNKVNLIKSNNSEQIIKGNVALGDVYTLKNGDKQLVIKVEPSTVKHETDIHVDSKIELHYDNLIDATAVKRKRTMMAGILLLLLLVLSVIFGINQKKTGEFNKSSEIKLNEAISFYDLKTRDSFINAKEIATKLKNEGYRSDKLDELLKNIGDNQSEILGEVNAEVSDLLDLTLQINGFKGTKIASTNDTMFVLDENEKNIIQLDINGKNAKIIAKKDVLDGLVSMASYQDKLFTLNKDGIYEINNKRIKVKDLDWGDSLFYLYSANIYMVDKGNNKIYRLSGTGKSTSDSSSSFADKVDWLAPGIEADFSKAIDMSIDGSIWVLSSSGKITKFTNGNPTNINMEGITTALTNPTAIYTNENLKNVYVLDKENGRVVAIDKSGKFKMQYVSEKIKNADDLVVNEEKGRIILLSGSKLNYISIQ